MSSGCGTGSTSTGESTSSSSPGVPLGSEGQCTKDVIQENNHTQQGIRKRKGNISGTRSSLWILALFYFFFRRQ